MRRRAGRYFRTVGIKNQKGDISLERKRKSAGTGTLYSLQKRNVTKGKKKGEETGPKALRRLGRYHMGERYNKTGGL